VEGLAGPPQRLDAPAPLHLPAGSAWASRLGWLLMIGLAIAVALLIALPLLRLAFTSVLTEAGSVSVASYVEAFGKLRHLAALGRSVLLGIGAVLLSGLIGVTLAWLVSRTDMAGRRLVTLSVVATFVMPPYLGAVAWMLLGGPNAGWINKAWIALGGATPLVNIYSFGGLVFLVALYLFPFHFVFARSALDMVSSELEDAATILGAGRRVTTLQVTLPMVMPALVGGSIVVFLEAITLFGTPALIGIPAGFTVATTQLAQFFEFPLRVETAAAYSMALLVITAALLGWQRWFLARRGYTAVSGKGGERRPIELGRWRWAAWGFCLAVATLAVIAPLAVLLQAAFSKSWSVGLSFANLTLQNFHYILVGHQSAALAVWNTLVYSIATAVLAVTVALVVVYANQRRLVRGAALLQAICTLPFAVPGIVLAVAFYATFAPPPFALYGTGAILVLAFLIRNLPIAVVQAGAGLRSLNPEMEDAARVLGAGRLTTLVRIVLPLLKSGLIGSWLLVFIGATRELSTAIFLTGPKTKVMSVLMLDLSEEGNFETLAALGCLMLAVACVVVVIGQRVAGRDFMLRNR
jgi:iron(III) transport system permease protein